MKGLPEYLFLETADRSAIVRAARELLAQAAAPSFALVLVAAADAPDLSELAQDLTAVPLAGPFFGGLFPGLIVGNEKHDRGALVLVLPQLGDLCDIEDFECIDSQLERLSLPGEERPTALVLMNGLTGHSSHFMRRLYGRLGNTVSYWGGGAGTLKTPEQHCLFSARGAFTDGAIVALTPLQATLGVRHGWSELAGPLVVTRSEGNRILELNWTEALTVYRQIVESDAQQPLLDGQFCDFARDYPLGLTKGDADAVVRDLVAIDKDTTLTCVGEVPENTVVSILRSSPDELIAAAGQAARDACAEPEAQRLNLIADCISRLFTLERRFEDELTAMYDAAAQTTENLQQLGMLTVGEISSSGAGHLEFFNKTAVVASLCGAGGRRR